MESATKKKIQSNKKIIFHCISGVLFVVLLGMSIFLSVENKKLNTDLDRIEGMKDELLAEKAEQYSILVDLRHEYNSQKRTIDTLHQKFDKISPEYNFYHQHAVIVGTDGVYYHKFDCPSLNTEYFYIFNTENAKAQGYISCPDCEWRY